MGAHFERAQILFSQSRYELAAKELCEELAADPENAGAHAMLAICLAHKKEFERALDEANAAVHLAPDDPYVHYARADVLDDMDRLKEAEEAIQEAIRLDPYDADYFALTSRILFQQQRFKKALKAAAAGLSIDPANQACMRARVLALIHLDRMKYVPQAVESALAMNAEDAFSHAARGYFLLDSTKYDEALNSFKEALRIDPEMEWARDGVVTALKKQYLLYRASLGFLALLPKIIMIAPAFFLCAGCFVWFMFADIIRGPWGWVAIFAYFAFFITLLGAKELADWIVDPFFDLVLRCNRFGRLTLSMEQVTTSNWFGAIVLVSLLCLLFGWVFHNGYAYSLAIGSGVMLLPVACVFQCSRGWPRNVMVAYTISVGVIGATGVALRWLAVTSEENPDGNLHFFGYLLPAIFQLLAFSSFWLVFAVETLKAKH